MLVLQIDPIMNEFDQVNQQFSKNVNVLLGHIRQIQTSRFSKLNLLAGNACSLSIVFVGMAELLADVRKEVMADLEKRNVTMSMTEIEKEVLSLFKVRKALQQEVNNTYVPFKLPNAPLPIPSDNIPAHVVLAAAATANAASSSSSSSSSSLSSSTTVNSYSHYTTFNITNGGSKPFSMCQQPV